MIGKTISHYKILEKLGEGSMGKVYKAEDTKLKREVALKFLPKEFSRDPESKERFIGEARTASVLDHHNICTIHEIDETNNGQLFISMNYYIGETLQEKIKNEQLSIDDTLNYITQIASGLQAAHKKQIVHCDIKPGNILITEDGIVKIVDFGIAKVCCEVKLKNKNNTSGTLAYMSPEQISNAEFDDKTDIWSFGVLFYEMLTKQRPFHDSYFEALMYSIMNEEPKSIKKINPDVSQELEKIVLKMLMKNPEKRYQNITNLLADINKVQIRKPSKSVAVLPFLNTRSDPNCDYLGFALADQVIGGLIYFKNITVRASSIIRKYENQVVDPLEVGKDLKVNYIVSGNFLQEGDVIRLNVELIEMQTNEMIWRTPIEVEYKNAFKLQDIVSDKVIKGLKIQFSQDEIDRIQSDVPQNPLAYEYYLRSLSYPITNEGIKLAIEMLEKSIEIDSNYAPAYNELGRRIHQMETFGYSKPIENKRPENYYLKALSINNELMSALSNLANIYTETDRTEEAVELTKQMLEINPNNAEAHFSLGYIYRYAGMTRESIDEMEKAVALDPNNSNLRVSIGVSYFIVGDYEKASEAFEVNKESPFSLGWQGYLLFRQGYYEQADEYFDRIIAIEPDGFWALSSLLWKEIMQGNTKEGLAILYEMEQSNVDDAETWYYLASEYALLGDRDGCVRCLRRAVDGGYFPYPTILKESYFDSMRGDQEFQNILEKAKEKHLAFKKRFF